MWQDDPVTSEELRDSERNRPLDRARGEAELGRRSVLQLVAWNRPARSLGGVADGEGGGWIVGGSDDVGKMIAIGKRRLIAGLSDYEVASDQALNGTPVGLACDRCKHPHQAVARRWIELPAIPQE